MKKEILSVGIDIGTTTTQVIFSKIRLQNTASIFLVPQVKITEKEIIYKSQIYFTPLIKREKINLEQIKEILHREYDKASINKKDIDTGAIIITGETARKENAEEVLSALSDFAGDFVVATAGPDLEGILAGFGAGAAEASKNFTSNVINFDIGGGTTNVAMFSNGEILDVFALDLGGRLIHFDSFGKIIYISSKIEPLIKHLKLNLFIGISPSYKELKVLTDAFAEILTKINNNEILIKEEELLFITFKNKNFKADLIMFSGGVAEFIYSDEEINNLKRAKAFQDIGPLLGYSIRKAFEDSKCTTLLEPKEKIRATVIGVGCHSLKISGSTIAFKEDILPIKNIPIIKLSNTDDLYKDICEKLKFYEDSYIAIAFKGPKAPTYAKIKAMAKSIVDAFENRNHPIIVIVENDFAKALGQSMNVILKESKKVICIDKIRVDNGDYVDIGCAIQNVLPVVIKTLIFKN